MCEACWGIETPEMIATAEEAVAKGIQWLDKKGPANWRELVDVAKLNIDDPVDCILGQVFADKVRNPEYTYTSWDSPGRMYTTGYEYAVYTFFEGSFDDTITAPLGFSGGLGINGSTMTSAWKRALAA
jgi:hypothetical protein